MAFIAGPARFVRRLLDLLLLLLILAALCGVGLGKLVPLTGSKTLAVGGGSMAPAIPVGAAVVVTPVRPEELARGDVVSMFAGQSRAIFTHRIVRVVSKDDGTWIETRGDANAAPDPTLVPAADVIGRVDWTIPYAGYLITLLSLPVGVMFVIGLALALMACTWLLESFELREGVRGSRVLRRIPVHRPDQALVPHARGPALAASRVGPRLATYLSGSQEAPAGAVRPTGDGWILPGRVVPARRDPRA